jgi:hypothetical protein
MIRFLKMMSGLVLTVTISACGPAEAPPVPETKSTGGNFGHY